jgi:small-conductance mechanosensitive channel
MNDPVVAGLVAAGALLAQPTGAVAPLVAALDPVVAWLRSLPAWQSAILLLVAGFLASRIVSRVAIETVGRAVDHTETSYDNVIFQELRLPIDVTLALGGAFLATEYVLEVGTTSFVLRGIAATLLLAVWTRGLVRLGDNLLDVYDSRSPESADFAPIFQNLWSFFVLVAALYLLLTAWQIDVTPLLASAGIAGIAVGFAAKDTVANFFGSIALYVDDTYTVGDYVELDQMAGTVVDVSIRSTRLLTRDNVIVTVPNSVLNAATIINRSAPHRKTRIKVPVGVAYGTDVDLVEDLLLEVAQTEDMVVSAPEPRVRFRRFGDSALEFELLCWVESPMLDARATHQLNRGVYAAFLDHDIEIPFPQRDLHVRSTTSDAHAGDGLLRGRGEAIAESDGGADTAPDVDPVDD